MLGTQNRLLLMGSVLAIALTAGIAKGDSARRRGREAFGDIKITKVIVMPNSAGHVDWIDAINGAHKSIHMTMYHLTDKAVINALIARANDKSLDMRIIVDGKSLTGGYALAAKSLTNAGVQLKGSSTGFSLTHSKDMVIDDKEAFIGAVDLTNTTTNMRDFTVVTPDASIIAEVEKVFEADWANIQNNGNTTPTVSNPNLAWGPVNADSQLVKVIDGATHSLVAETENFDNTDIIDAFNRAAARGVEVRLITPECSFGNAALNYQGVAQLTGVSVHMEHDGDNSTQPYMHSKMMVVDGDTVYVGSINLSFNSITADRELGTIFTDSQVGSQFASEFEIDWNRSQVPAASAAACPAN